MTTASAPPVGTGETLVVVNPASGSGRTARRWQQLEQQLTGLGVQARTRLTGRPGDATDMTRAFLRAGGRDIVVMGGDGTLNEVVAGCVTEDGGGLVAEGVTLAVVHQGTGGDLARGLGIPKDPDEAVRTAVAGRAMPVDVGVATFRAPDGSTQSRGWVSCCNVGLGAEVVAKVVGNLKRLGNSAAFGIASVTSLMRNRPRRVSIAIDGACHELDIVDVMVANNRYVGGGMFVAPGAKVDDGLLDVVIVGYAPRTRLLRTFPKIYKGTHIADEIVRWQQASELVIDAPDTPQGVVLDGELVGTTPARFRLLPRAISIRVP